jgi:hypothetical protein
MRLARAVFVLASLAATTVSCAQERSPGASTPRAGWTLSVANEHWLDVEIFVAHTGLTTRVGLVTAATTQGFELPPLTPASGAEVRLVGRAIGGGAEIASEPFLVRSGNRVEWTLARNLAHASLAVH